MRQPTDLEKNQFEYYNQLDMDSLLIAIGRMSRLKEGIQFSPDTAKKEGKKWFDSIRKALEQRICLEWNYCEKRNDERFKDGATLAVEISDLILGLAGNIPVMSISALLIKMGLDKFCGCKGTSEPRKQ